MSGFKINQTNKDQKLFITVSGALDEDAKLPPVDFSNITEVNFDFAGLTAINSCGIRDWMKWISIIPVSTKIFYQNCPKIIIDQINMVEGFLPRLAQVTSFFVPYYCESCDCVENKLSSPSDSFSQTVVCSQCGKDAEIDVIENKYFKFLKR